jgi:flagellar M-ring protein FliF
MLPPQVAGFVSQPALARALPALGTLGAVAAAAWLWMAISSGPNRVLYTSLTDAERAKVVETLAQAEIEDVHRRTSVRPRAARPAP